MAIGQREREGRNGHRTMQSFASGSPEKTSASLAGWHEQVRTSCTGGICLHSGRQQSTARTVWHVMVLSTRSRAYGPRSPQDHRSSTHNLTAQAAVKGTGKRWVYACLPAPGPTLNRSAQVQTGGTRHGIACAASFGRLWWVTCICICTRHACMLVFIRQKRVWC
jgi:hypothetical protein